MRTSGRRDPPASFTPRRLASASSTTSRPTIRPRTPKAMAPGDRHDAGHDGNRDVHDVVESSAAARSAPRLAEVDLADHVGAHPR